MPVQQSPRSQPPVQQAPVQQPPLPEAPVQQPPVQQAPVQQPPLHQAPDYQVPVQQPPVEHIPMVDEPTVVQPVVQPRLPDPQPPAPDHRSPPPEHRPRLPDHQPPLPPVHRPAEERLDPPPRPEPRDPASGSEPAYGRRGPAVFAAIAAVLAAVISVAALVFVLADRGDDNRPDVPTLGGGPPPSDVRVDDFGTSVTVSWTDPGQGTTSFIITGGHPGEVLRSMGTVGPGQTRFTLQGLNDQLDYCFAVLAVYSTTEFASSPQSCTSRPDPQPTG
jgi:hypothetical protein